MPIDREIWKCHEVLIMHNIFFFIYVAWFFIKKSVIFIIFLQQILNNKILKVV